jgi:plastocyanin
MSSRETMFTALALLSMCSACGQSGSSSSAPAQSAAGSSDSRTAAADTSSKGSSAPQSGESASGAKHEKRAVDPKTVGSIRGVIKLDGTPPERKEMAIGNTTGCEKHPVPPLTEDVIADGGKLANVFVYIKSGFDEWIVPPPASATVVLNQEGCMYRPRVLGVQLGQKLAVKNSDPTNHNVHSRPERNDGFNQTQASGSPPVEWQAAKPELMIPFACDIHPWMKAWVSVREHPWFAVSDASGAFTIAGVPPGEYTLEACHEKYGKKTGKVSVPASGAGEIAITFAVK